jgi:hypothetical protein
MALNHPQRRAIGFLASEYGGSLITMPKVGPKTIVALIKLGLIEVAPHNLHDEPRYRLTKTGNNMHDELSRFMLIPRKGNRVQGLSALVSGRGKLQS